MIENILILLLLYVVVGIVFAIAFFLVGYKKIDSGAEGAGWRVRLLWMSGAIAVWPLLAMKWKSSNSNGGN